MIGWLLPLADTQQNRAFHPEGDALFHTLQVFELALRDLTADPSDGVDADMLAAALFHDVGKSISGPDHAQIGADIASAWCSERTCWLIEHHLHLLRWPKKTRSWLYGSGALADLERLRRWDEGGRCRQAVVRSPAEAVDVLLSCWVPS